MKILFAITLLATVGLSAIIPLDSGNFDRALEVNDVVLVEFHAKWCQHC